MIYSTDSVQYFNEITYTLGAWSLVFAIFSVATLNSLCAIS